MKQGKSLLAPTSFQVLSMKTQRFAMSHIWVGFSSGTQQPPRYFQMELSGRSYDNQTYHKEE